MKIELTQSQLAVTNFYRDMFITEAQIAAGLTLEDLKLERRRLRLVDNCEHSIARLLAPRNWVQPLTPAEVDQANEDGAETSIYAEAHTDEEIDKRWMRDALTVLRNLNSNDGADWRAAVKDKSAGTGGEAMQ